MIRKYHYQKPQTTPRQREEEPVSIWCLGLGVVFDCIDFWSLPSSLLLLQLSVVHLSNYVAV